MKRASMILRGARLVALAALLAGAAMAAETTGELKRLRDGVFSNTMTVAEVLRGIKEHPELLHAKDDLGHALLYSAMNLGRYDIALALVDLYTKQEIDAEDVFHTAVFGSLQDKGLFPVIDRILGKKPDLMKKNRDGLVPFQCAIYHIDCDRLDWLDKDQYVAMLSKLLPGREDGFDVSGVQDVGPFKGFTLLHLACGTDNRWAAEFLIKAGADVNVMMPASGSFPLHAASTCFPHLVKLLLDRGAVCNRRGFQGWTELHYCVTYNRPGQLSDGDAAAIIDLLCERGADPTIRDKKGETPLETAKRLGRPGIIPKLTEKTRAWESKKTK